MATPSNRIATALLDAGAVLLRPQRPFTWASGIQSPIYCDNRLLLSDPKRRRLVVTVFVSAIRRGRLAADVIAGTATAGIPWASLIAGRLNKPLVYVRSAPKGHGRGNQIEGKLPRGARVLVIEDLISTGGSSLHVVDALRKAGGRVTACLAIFSYGFASAAAAFARARVPLVPLCTLPELLEVAVARRKLTPAQYDRVYAFALETGRSDC